MEYYGYAGNILHVDLTTGQITKQPLDIDRAREFIGGQGTGLRLLIDMIKPNIDPLSPENVLLFGAGPLIGTLTPGSGKCNLDTKYAIPASKDRKKYFVSTSMFGSHRFGAMMKNAGYDHIAVTGRAEKPSYLKVTNEDVEICDAGDLCGKGVYETGRILRARHRGRTGDCGTLVIGKAGERMIKISLGWTDDWHHAGRFAGAIAGAKNLKAVVTHGDRGIKVFDRKRFLGLIHEKRQEILGIPGHESRKPAGIGPVPVNPLVSETTVGLRGCSGGMCACKCTLEAKEGRFKGTRFGGTYNMVPLWLMDIFQLTDYGEAFKFINVLNDSGLCLATLINMIPFVTRLYKNGLLSKEDLQGLEPKNGTMDFPLALTEKILNKEGIGAVMAEGWYALCEKVGIDFLKDPQIGVAVGKGVDFLVDARNWGGFGPAMGLAPIIHPKTKHTHSATYWPRGEISIEHVKRDAERMGLTKEEMNRVFTKDSFDTGRLEKYGGEAEVVCNSLGFCSCTLHYDYDPMRDMAWLSEVYSAVTGLDITPRGLLRAGERVYNLQKLLNVREGFTREDDKIPQVYLSEDDSSITDWFGKPLTREDLEETLDHYYEERGWHIRQGVPTREKLLELGLEEYSHIVEPYESV